ncbi:MAG: hypothetical protein O8C66_07685 [Candidatus Methanoperedens sp.]|nr:hypothetical protein [Candidatus Methanoperedens sp.]MCZ7370376.1 hypothetical protein [Candidatus Methanoperedens sp.]
MSNKSILFLILIVPAILISGCIFSKPTQVTPQSQVIPQKNLPSGFTFMGIHEATVDIGGSSMNATEGVYRNNNEDIYIQVIKNDQPSFLVDQYKQTYKNAKYDPFEEVLFNGHNATKVKDYETKNGKQLMTFTVIWANVDSMIIVGSSNDSNSVLNLAAATLH